MKQVTQNFINDIKTYGRQFNFKIKINDKDVSDDDVNYIKPSFNSKLFQTIMHQIEIDFKNNIPLKSKIKISAGIKVNEPDYEYINFNTCVVNTSEKQEDTNSYVVVAYDKMIESMVDYDLTIAEKITLRDYLIKICQRLGWNTNNIPATFINSDKLVDPMLHVGIGYTFRDVLDEIATISCSFLLFKDEDFYLMYPTETNQNIDNEFLNEDNVTIGEKYFINSLVFSRAEESDNIFRKDNENITLNGLHEYRISDNQLLSTNDRDLYIDEMFDYLKTFEFYIFDVSSKGILFLEACDRFNFTLGGITYSTILLNNEISFEDGLSEEIYIDKPEETKTEYKYADTTDKRINQAYIMVDKQNKKITQLASEVSEYESKVTEVEQTVDGISQKVESIADFTREQTELNQVHLSDTVQGVGYVLNLKIKGNTANFIYLTPNDTLVPSDTLVPLGGHFTLVSDKQDRNAMSDEAQVIDIVLEEPLRNLEDIYDELNITNGKVIVTRRIGVNEDLNLYVLDNEIIEDLGIVQLNTFEENTYIYIKEYKALEYTCKYIIKSDYSDAFATQTDLENAIVELDTAITQTAEEIQTEVNKKVGNNEFGTKIIQNFESVRIAWNQISDYIKFINAQLNIYDKNDNLLMALTKLGQYFYSEGNYIGKIGTNKIANYEHLKTLDFDLDVNGNAMIWASVNNKQDNVYYWKWAYSKGGTDYAPNEGLYAGTDIYMQGYKLYLYSSVYLLNNALYQSGNGFFFIGDSGKVEIYNGNIYCDGEVYAENISSDGRLKKNIKESEINAIETLCKIPIRSFDWKKNNKHIKAGFIAQEMEKIDENFVLKKEILNENKEIIDNRYYINELPIISTLVKGFQEQQDEINSLKNTVEKQQNLINELCEKIGLEQKEINEARKTKNIQQVVRYDSEIVKENKIIKDKPIKISTKKKRR